MLKPYEPHCFALARVTDAWNKYEGVLTFGRGQTLAILDDGFETHDPVWRTKLPWGEAKVIRTYDVMTTRENAYPVGAGYHGTSLGYPSSMQHDGVGGVAFNNRVALVHSNEVVHLVKDESETIADALQWVIDHRRDLNITTVNLAAVDDKPHPDAVPTAIDEKLAVLRELNVWVSAPAANNEYTTGISWPACAEKCFAIGAVKHNRDEVHRDRFSNIDIVVPAQATSSSNAIICGAAMLLREAIALRNYNWRRDGRTLPDAQMAIFKRTGKDVHDPATNLTFRRIDVCAAIDSVMGQ